MHIDFSELLKTSQTTAKNMLSEKIEEYISKDTQENVVDVANGIFNLLLQVPRTMFQMVFNLIESSLQPSTPVLALAFSGAMTGCVPTEHAHDVVPDSSIDHQIESEQDIDQTPSAFLEEAALNTGVRDALWVSKLRTKTQPDGTEVTDYRVGLKHVTHDDVGRFVEYIDEADYPLWIDTVDTKDSWHNTGMVTAVIQTYHIK